MTGPATPDEMPFSLEWLAGAAGNIRAVDVCDRGHLVINGNSHWQALRFAGLKALVCRLVEDHTGPA